MFRIAFILVAILFIGCSNTFEPDLTGWQARAVPGRRLNITHNEQQVTYNLPGGEETGYRYAQWTKSGDLLLLQITKTEQCYAFQIVLVDSIGSIVDTLYTAPTNTALNFKLAPNDSLMLLKTYKDDCVESKDFVYTFIDRFTLEPLSDTIAVDDARGVLMKETVWSPDSKKVIIQDKVVGGIGAFVYDLVSKQRTPIDIGGNFVWSPTDPDAVAYLREHSIYMWNAGTGEKAIFLEGNSERGALDFRWNPTGEFLMIHVRSYLLGMEAGPFQQTRIMYMSVKDKVESRMYYGDDRVDTWRE